jgi:hypothetical protein
MLKVQSTHGSDCSSSGMINLHNPSRADEIRQLTFAEQASEGSTMVYARGSFYDRKARDG